MRLVAGGRSAIKTHVDTVSHHPHMLLFLTLDTEEDDPAEKVHVTSTPLDIVVIDVIFVNMLHAGYIVQIPSI